MQSASGSLKHVAIIPDGNNRWAKKHGVSSLQAYMRGEDVVESVVRRAADIGIPYVTAYLMSLENFEKRSSAWKELFFDFMERTINKYLVSDELNDVRIKVIGRPSVLPDHLVEGLRALEERTFANERAITFTVAVAYSGRNEIVRAMEKCFNSILSKQPKLGKIITEEFFEQFLDTSPTPPPDLLIRTSGEQRLSGFLLWQMAYTEFYFSKKLWPDFSADDFSAAVEDFYSRKRNFGKDRAE
ncbi:MAG: di-trans,poly-cis-decaprenylcistransferase [Holosporales bacterium]|nr:di-trans,poly-cis-decaprenylcistransferase [Holosporales bacterium]